MKKTISVLLSIVIMMLVFAGCSGESKKASIAQNNVETVISAVYPVDDTVVQHTKKQALYLNNSLSSFVLYTNGKKEKSRPEPVEFVWQYNGSADTEYILKLIEI